MFDIFFAQPHTPLNTFQQCRLRWVSTDLVCASLTCGTTHTLRDAGRIGRLVTRATLQRDDLEVVAINDPSMDAEDCAYLLKYDTTQGTLTNAVHADGDDLVVDGRRIRCTSHANPADVPWAQAGVQVVCESSGKFLDVSRW